MSYFDFLMKFVRESMKNRTRLSLVLAVGVITWILTGYVVVTSVQWLTAFPYFDKSLFFTLWVLELSFLFMPWLRSRRLKKEEIEEIATAVARATAREIVKALEEQKQKERQSVAK